MNSNRSNSTRINKIQIFDGEHAFLSNFYECAVLYNNRMFSSSEAAFQSEKCIEEAEKDKFINLTPFASKKLGKKIQIRPDWEDVKEQIMYDIVYAKFSQNQDLKDKLLATDNTYLVEGNYWRDQFWGVCPENGNPGIDGLNVLGQILMRVRAELRYKRKEINLCQ